MKGVVVVGDESAFGGAPNFAEPIGWQSNVELRS
jgi:hypothetical protein